MKEESLGTPLSLSGQTNMQIHSRNDTYIAIGKVKPKIQPLLKSQCYRRPNLPTWNRCAKLHSKGWVHVAWAIIVHCS